MQFECRQTDGDRQNPKPRRTTQTVKHSEKEITKPIYESRRPTKLKTDTIYFNEGRSGCVYKCYWQLIVMCSPLDELNCFFGPTSA